MGSNGGFTLIELILVTVIIGILAGMVVLQFGGRAEEARIRAAKGDIMSLGSAIEMFSLDNNGKYPKSLNELIGGKRDYIRDIKSDPWGNAYIYECPGSIHKNSYDVFSAGPDGIKGNGDDVSTMSSTQLNPISTSLTIDTGGVNHGTFACA